MSKKNSTETNNSEERNDKQVVTLPEGTLFAVMHLSDNNYQIIFNTEMTAIEYVQLISILSSFVEENTTVEKPRSFSDLPC